MKVNRNFCAKNTIERNFLLWIFSKTIQFFFSSCLHTTFFSRIWWKQRKKRTETETMSGLPECYWMNLCICFVYHEQNIVQEFGSVFFFHSREHFSVWWECVWIMRFSCRVIKIRTCETIEGINLCNACGIYFNLTKCKTKVMSPIRFVIEYVGIILCSSFYV